MFCQACNIEIPPAWVKVIQSNVCPQCGEPIMTEESKQLLEELKEAMSKMENDPAGLAGWLLSHYQLKKVGNGEPTGFYNKAAQQQKMKIAPNKAHQFLQRAGVGKTVEEQNKYSNLIEAINSGDIDSELYGDDQEEGYEDQETDYDEALTARQQFTSNAKRKANNSLLLPGQTGNGAPLSVQEQAALKARTEKSGGPTLGAQALQQARLERLQKQEGIANGSIPSSFRRGS